jgi:hypothetical protein
VRRTVTAPSAGSNLGQSDHLRSVVQRSRGIRAFTGRNGVSAPSLRLAGLALVAAALFFSVASTAFADRTYQSQLTQANSTALSSPIGLAVDDSDNVWVSDTNTSLVSKFDSSGTYLAQSDGTGSWGTSGYIQDLAFGKTAGLVYVVDSGGDDLWGLNKADATYASVDVTDGLSGCCFIRAAVDNSSTATDGDVYIAVGGSETVAVTVDRVDGTGAASNFSAVQSYITANKLTGTPAHAFASLGGIATDAAGNVYVVDPGNDEVDEFDSTGTFVQAIAGPVGAALSDVAVDPTNGNVLVGDTTLSVVHEYDSSGTFVEDIDGTGTPGGTVVPQGLAVDSTGRLYVADSAHPVVDVFGHFAITHTVSVSKTGGGSGTVTSAPAGINCGGTCSNAFEENSTVTLTASPSAHNALTGWTVDGSASTCPGTGTCDVPVGTTDHTVVANFEHITHTLTVAKAGTGGGTVTSAPAGVNCGATCNSLFNEGASVTLTAAPAAGSTFTGWSGPGAASCPGTGTCHVTIPGADTSVTATFAQSKPTVTTTAGATGISQHAASVAGTVNPNSGAVSSCQIQYGKTTAYGSQAPCSPNPGAGGSAVGVHAALSGLTAATTYHFRVVAANAGGTTNGSDQTFKTLADVTPPPTCATDPSLCTPGVLKLDATTARVTGSKAALKLSCSGEKACSGKLTLTAKVKVRKGKKTVTKTMTIGTARVSIAAGASKTVKIKLNSAARKVLAKKHRLSAKLAGAGLKHTVVLKSAKKKKKK